MSTGTAKQFYGEGTAVIPSACAYCGLHHDTVCPRIQEIEYHPNGTLKRVVLRPSLREGQ
jgi:hypothetical protein